MRGEEISTKHRALTSVLRQEDKCQGLTLQGREERMSRDPRLLQIPAQWLASHRALASVFSLPL